MSLTTVITRFPIASYFALAFAVSWGGVLLILSWSGPLHGAATPDGVLLPAAVLMLAGPSVAAIVAAAVGRREVGLGASLASALRWRVDSRWYAVALLTAPLLAGSALVASSLASAGFAPSILTTTDPAALLLTSIAIGLAAGVFEELGWTGYAVARLQPRHGVRLTGLVVGAAWGAWHLMLVPVLMNAPGASLPPAGVVALALFVVLPLFRIVMVWVYAATDSLLLAVLMHASLTATSLLASPQGPGGPSTAVAAMAAHHSQHFAARDHGR